MPILHNITGSQNPNLFYWIYDTPQAITLSYPGQPAGAQVSPVNCFLEGDSTLWSNVNNYSISATSNASTFTVQQVHYFPSNGAIDLPPSCDLQVRVKVQGHNFCLGYDPTITFTIPAGETTSTTSPITFNCNCNIANFICTPIEYSIVEIVPQPKTGQKIQVINSTGGPVTGNFRLFCEFSPSDHVIPAGVSEICIYLPQTLTPIAGISYTVIGDCAACKDVVNPTTYTNYFSTVTENQPCLTLVSSSIPEYQNRLIKFSNTVSNALFNNTSIIFSGSSDPAASYSNIETIVTPFTLETGDAIHFFSASMGWLQGEEYRVVSTFFSGSNVFTTSGNANPSFYALLDRTVNRNVLTYPTQSQADTPICTYIVAKHLPDETNLILNSDYHLKGEEGNSQSGIVYPQYIEEAIRKNAGNVIKALKSQGLI